MINPSEIIIPELEEAREASGGKAICGIGRKWSPREEALLNRYHGYVKMALLMKYLPGRTQNSIEGKAHAMRLTNRGSKEMVQ